MLNVVLFLFALRASSIKSVRKSSPLQSFLWKPSGRSSCVAPEVNLTLLNTISFISAIPDQASQPRCRVSTGWTSEVWLSRPSAITSEACASNVKLRPTLKDASPSWLATLSCETLLPSGYTDPCRKETTRRQGRLPEQPASRPGQPRTTNGTVCRREYRRRTSLSLLIFCAIGKASPGRTSICGPSHAGSVPCRQGSAYGALGAAPVASVWLHARSLKISNGLSLDALAIPIGSTGLTPSSHSFGTRVRRWTRSTVCI